jgi:RimJ/RimL family protein N-acetyltransferase
VPLLILAMQIDISKLRGKHVYLELLQPGHTEMIRPLAKDERIWEFNKGLLINENYDALFDAYLAHALDKDALGGQHAFVIREQAGNAVIGMTRLYEMSSKDKIATIGYTWYIPAVWRKVHNKECKLLLLQYVFEELKFNRTEFRVAHQNIRSQRAVEKIGGLKEGVLRKHGYRNDGSIRDTVIFSIINDEWPSKKEKLLQMIAENENQ